LQPATICSSGRRPAVFICPEKCSRGNTAGVSFHPKTAIFPNHHEPSEEGV
jgi:hypothetical protein